MKKIDSIEPNPSVEQVADSTPHRAYDTFERRPEKDLESRRFFTARDLLDMEIEDTPMLWDTYLQQVGVACLTGPSDSGKSTLTKQIAKGIATGANQLFNRNLYTRSRNVLFIITEDTVEAVAAVIHHQMSDENGIEYENIHFLWMEDPATIQEEILDILQQKPYDLVVVDVWMDIFQGSPNNLADVRADLWCYHKMAVDFKCLFLFIHHNSKAGSNQEPHKNGVNGSQGIEAKMRAVLDMRNVKDNLFVFTIVKSNYCLNEFKNKPYALKLDQERRLFQKSDEAVQMTNTLDTRVTYTDEKMKRRIIELKKDGFSFEKITPILAEEFPGKKTPGQTWMKDFYRRFLDSTDSLPMDQDEED